jgi:hypothetical protein
MTDLKSGGSVPIDIGSRLELMVDDYLIARLNADAERRLNRPVPQEVVMVMDKPWEGNASAAFTIFQDGDIYRMYYNARQFEISGTTLSEPTGVTCYAESTDGINWVKPDLGLIEHNGSKKNNIIIDTQQSNIPPNGFVPFKDTNPNAPADAKYKAWAKPAFFKSKEKPYYSVRGGASRKGHGPEVPDGLHALKSHDGIHWTTMSDGPVIEDGLLDSQNLAFWDSVRGEYRDYHRNEFRIGKTGEEPYSAHTVNGKNGASLRGSRYGRDMRTATSSDFIHWSEPEYINYTQGRTDELYNNAIIPYFRAPHIFVGLPTRYIDPGWSDAIEDLPELEHRRQRANVSERYGTALTDTMFMSSRDGQTFDLWPESFIRPGLRPQDNWTYMDNYPSWGLVTTKSMFPGAPDDISIYAVEGYWRGDSTILRRYNMRLDGFVSVQAPLSGGELITKPLIFEGNELVINFSASAAGSIRVELLRDQMDMPIEGFGLENCIEVLGDDLDRVVRWSGGNDLSNLSGVPLRLRFVLKDADLYSLRFR